MSNPTYVLCFTKTEVGNAIRGETVARKSHTLPLGNHINANTFYQGEGSSDFLDGYGAIGNLWNGTKFPR